MHISTLAVLRLAPSLTALTLLATTDVCRGDSDFCRLAVDGSEACEDGGSLVPVDDPELPGVDRSWWDAATAGIAGAEYTPSPSPAGIHAPNRAHNLRTTFGEQGIEVTPRTSAESTTSVAPAWRFTWKTTGIGRRDQMQSVSTASPRIDESRVVYAREGWTEWYENTAKGLEQGFTIECRPGGQGPLQVSGTVPGGLEPHLQTDGAVDFFDTHGVQVLRYGEPHAWDARGVDLPAELAVEASELVIVVDDSGAEYPITIDPLLTSPAWTAESNQSGALLGFSVATAGDVNGDGFSDVIVGAWGYDNGQTSEGRALVYHGSASGLSFTAQWTAESNQAAALFGYSVATAGDVNGDGYDDVIVGAFSYDNGQTDEGRAFVYHGSANGLSSAPNWTAESDQANAQFGISVATAGDIDGDGFDEVIVGAPFFDDDQSDEGRASVYHGSSSGLSLTPDWTAESDQTGAQLGFSVATAGDVNGDGFGDVVIGAWVYANGQGNEGRAFVYEGSSSGLSTTPDWIAESNQANAYFGVSVAGAGDVNGDGYADVIVGAHGFSNGQSSEGKVFVYHGGPGGLSATAAWTKETDQADSSLGHSVATAGDVNGDGYADVIVGAMNFSNGQFTEGRANVYVGSRLGLENLAYWTAESNQASANFAISVATAGDVNGDGFSDVIVGSWLFDGGQTDEGRAFVYHGSAGGLVLVPQWAVGGEQNDAHLGYSVATAGDVNGDGFSDVIVGANSYDNGQFNEGRAFVYHGSPTGWSGVPNWTAESDQAGANFGYSVATAGDANGDGFSDVIVGAPFFDGGQPDEGRVYVYYGSAGGLSFTPGWIAENDLEDGSFGRSVATAGDVNGDGFADVVIGAPHTIQGLPNNGRAFVYQGSATGLASSPAWITQSDQVNSNFGISASTAGDVNGDGFSDVIVGANFYNGGQSEEGRAFLYYGSGAGLATSPAWTAESNQDFSYFGSSVSTAGDVNGDGYADVIVGAPTFSAGSSSEGRAFVYHGSATGPVIANWTAESDNTDSRFGTSVGTAGDVDGDGYSDVIIGAPRYHGDLTNEGRAYVYHGSSIGLSPAPRWILESNQEFAQTGSSVATSGDVNGDGYSDVIVGLPGYNDGQSGEGLAMGIYGNERRGLDRLPRQARTDDSAPISLLGASDSPSSFLVKALGRTPAGRGQVRLQFEVKPFGVPFDGTEIQSGDSFDTGTPMAGSGSAVPLSELATGLAPETLYHWRLRIAAESPFFPRTAWMGMPFNSSTEADLRTGASTTGIQTADNQGVRESLIEPIRPNPFVRNGEIAFTLPKATEARLTVLDIAGREQAVLIEGAHAAGRHVLRWNGRSDSGAKLPAGVYLLRLETSDRETSQKVILTH